MRLWDVPVEDPRPALADERGDLLTLLAGLGDADWLAPTEAGHWRVKDVALHLLDDDLGWLSRSRDRDLSGLLPTVGDHRAFVAALDAKNERWVVGAAGLSRRVVVDLLRWSGDEVARCHATLDPTAPSTVVWAADGDVPCWFDLARDLTERWVHQQHIRDAVGRPGNHERFLPRVLRTFVWAFPHQYRAPAPDGTTVEVDVDTGGRWTLARDGDCWTLVEGPARSPAARLAMPAPVAWRQLTGLPAGRQLALDGDRSLAEALLDVRGIIV